MSERDLKIVKLQVIAAWRNRTEMWYNCGMRTIAENANDFLDLRTADGGNCVYVDKTDYFRPIFSGT